MATQNWPDNSERNSFFCQPHFYPQILSVIISLIFLGQKSDGEKSKETFGNTLPSPKVLSIQVEYKYGFKYIVVTKRSTEDLLSGHGRSKKSLNRLQIFFYVSEKNSKYYRSYHFFKIKGSVTKGFCEDRGKSLVL